jgi:tetratricopeptide (TPR) repeat protein
MSDNYTHNESLIQYLDGELPQDQIAGLEAAIAASASLQEKLQHLRATREGVKMYGLRQQVQSIHAEMIPEIRPASEWTDSGQADDQTFQTRQTLTRQVDTHSGQPTIPARANGLGHPARPARIAFMPRLMRVAAIVIFAIGMVTLYQYLRLSSADLYGENLQAFTIRESRGETADQPLKQAFKNDLMQEVIRLLQQSPTPSPEDYFLAGNAYLALGQPAEAINAFQQVQMINQQQRTHVLGDEAEYYLAMSYLDNRQPALALPIFKKIHDDPAQLYHDKVSGWFLFKLHWLRQGQ